MRISDWSSDVCSSDLDDPQASAYRDVAHHRLLCEAFEKVERGECLRLAVSIPPQHGKSRTLTLSGAAWFMGRHPHKHMILGFYNQDFANENGAITREIMQTSGYKAAFPGTTFQKASKGTEEHTSELQSLMRISYAVFGLDKKKERSTKHMSETQSQM